MSHAEDTTREARNDELVSDLLSGKHRALARAITKIENRSPGYRDLVSRLHAHTGDADVIGITGSPGAGKSTLVDKLAKAYRDDGLTVGVIGVDPSSPYTGGAVLGDRIRMASNVGDMDVFFRSMSARGQLGGLSTATSDAVKALDAFGKDKIIVETVGAGQNEVDIVRTADTVTVLVQPGSGDDVQMLKAGILEIGDVFVVNKADMDGVNRTVAELEEMIHLRDNPGAKLDTGHHGVDTSLPAGVSEANGQANGADTDEPDDAADDDPEWKPAIVETVATTGDGVDELVETLGAHAEFLTESGMREQKARTRYAEEIRQLLRNDANELLKEELDRHGGVESLAAAVADRETDPYAVASEVIEPLRDCVKSHRDE
ncbi:methylmalonyl Co-A mutase-associated GTPase MeaB [Halogeometricum borinquense]|uniref:Methylmalonyl Co-A mutase-associated GTPase MeaB n=1 Tax=Halogeometricum borinquense TaxID=60847 RepID=A0A6C0UDK5_9EURY|nr:methylmalonyl Co-A mutase-associated GTPase MeaB [Halogeometricum borinquense]QIB73444.1 methylmalonyl Co-A mutase-associated GTPase MeaB [Halogeometricum borinquense]QIQ77154.1 methylmalonyl Co-A mutase-associated GTPase MeaB [Halogeometricum borinquense]